MVTSKKVESPVCRPQSQGKIIKQVNTFKYLGYSINAEGKCLPEVKKRIALAKDAFNRMKSIMKDKNILMNTKMRIMKTYIWSVFLYGCESCTVSKEIENRIAAAEMWFLRRILRISWVDKVSNEEVLRKAGKQRELLQHIRKRLGHVYRKDALARTVLRKKEKGIVVDRG